jgi:hypothetical protein
LNSAYSFKIYTTTAHLPSNWDDIAISTVFLSKKYLDVLEKSSPENMICHYIGLFENNTLIGIALSQFLNLNKLESFGERDKCIKTAVRNFVFRNFGSHVLVIGNNMLTGQNSFALLESTDKKKALQALNTAVTELKKQFKDYYESIYELHRCDSKVTPEYFLTTLLTEKKIQKILTDTLYDHDYNNNITIIKENDNNINIMYVRYCYFNMC